MSTLVSTSHQGGGLHGRLIVEVQQDFFERVQRNLKEKGYETEAQNLQYHDLFTLSGSTSYGSLFNVAMSKFSGKNRPYFFSPKEFGEFMDQNAGRIFPHYEGVLGKVFNSPRQILGGITGATKFSNKPLRGIIQDIVGKKAMMSDIEDDIMITMTKVHPTLDAFFAKSHVARGENTQFDYDFDKKKKNWIVWQAALGSASPTTYLPGVELTNPNRDDRIVVIDGGQSGWNNPSIPVLSELSFIYGRASNEPDDCMIYDSKLGVNRGYALPHDIVHVHWGTGDFNVQVSRTDAMKNTLLSMKSIVATSSMQAVHRFSISSGQRQLEHYYNFDVSISEIPDDIRPKDDFTLSTKDQMQRLKDAGQYAVERLAPRLERAARRVAEAHIEKIEYNRNNPGVSYKDHLRANVCEIG